MAQLSLVCVFVLTAAAASAQEGAAPDSAKAIADRIYTLRSLPDDQRAEATKELALAIRKLPEGAKLGAASNLANLSTEGDFGRETLQEVTTTLEQALRESRKKPDSAYDELANLARYEHMQVGLNDSKYAAAMARLEDDDKARAAADFTLRDLDGKSWTLKRLRGKVVVVNFWATWCPPCRKEIPDLEALYEKFRDQGLVVLAISDEKADKVKPFVAEKKMTYPVLLDSGVVHKMFRVEGIPKNFVFDREGKLVAQAIDMRTRNQFLEMLAAAGLK